MSASSRTTETNPKASRFVRLPVALPTDFSGETGSEAARGYFAASGFSPGQQVVVRGAGLLLAHEVGATAGADAEGD